MTGATIGHLRTRSLGRSAAYGVQGPAVRGFSVSERSDRWDAFYDVAWVRDGRMKYREDVVEGLERAPEAFIRFVAGSQLRQTTSARQRVTPESTADARRVMAISR